MDQDPSKNSRPQTYVGDKFTLSLFKRDDEKLSSLDGEKGVLVGFVKKIKYVMEHEVAAQTPQSGVYTCLGDAVVRLNCGKVVRVPLVNLEPVGYTFDDHNVKNLNYLKEAAKHNYLGPLPYLPYNYGDKVIVAQHGRLNDDAIGTIVDTFFKGQQVFYLVDTGNDTIEVAKEKIIDVLDLGDFSEHNRYRNQMRTLERIVNNHMRGFKHDDEENSLENPWLEE